MLVQAKVKNALITPRKARLIIDLVRDKSVAEAFGILDFAPQKSARIVTKLIKSAAANASHNFGFSKDNLQIKSIEAQSGMVLKRWMPRAHGHATPILKKRSHITVALEEIKETQGTKDKPSQIAGRKSKMKTFSYEEVKKVMKDAEKASKMIKKKGEKAESPKQKPQKGEKIIQKEIESRPRFTRLGDTFKKMFHRTTKKG